MVFVIVLIAGMLSEEPLCRIQHRNHEEDRWKALTPWIACSESSLRLQASAELRIQERPYVDSLDMDESVQPWLNEPRRQDSIDFMDFFFEEPGDLKVVQLKPWVELDSSYSTGVVGRVTQLHPASLWGTQSIEDPFWIKPGRNVFKWLSLADTTQRLEDDLNAVLRRMQASEIHVEIEVEGGRRYILREDGLQLLPDSNPEVFDTVRRERLEKTIPARLRLTGMFGEKKKIYKITGNPEELLVGGSEDYRLVDGGKYELLVVEKNEATIVWVQVSEIRTQTVTRIDSVIVRRGRAVKFEFSLADKIEEIWLGRMCWPRSRIQFRRGGIVELQIPEVPDHVLSVVVQDDYLQLRSIFEIEIVDHQDIVQERTPVPSSWLLRVAVWIIVLGAVLFPAEVSKLRESMGRLRKKSSEEILLPTPLPSSSPVSPSASASKRVATKRRSLQTPTVIPDLRSTTEETRISVEEAIAASLALNQRPVEAPVASKKKRKSTPAKPRRVSDSVMSENKFDSSGFFFDGNVTPSFVTPRPALPEPVASTSAPFSEEVDLPPEVLEALAALLLRLNDEFHESPVLETPVVLPPYFL